MKLSRAQIDVLKAVEKGLVLHAHPFRWGLNDHALACAGSGRTLSALERARLIKVKANAAGYWRPVELTEAGRKALSDMEKQT